MFTAFVIYEALSHSSFILIFITQYSRGVGAGLPGSEAPRSPVTFLKSQNWDGQSWGWLVLQTRRSPQCIFHKQRFQSKKKKKRKSTNKFMCSLLEADLPLWNFEHFHFLVPDLHAVNISSSFVLSLPHGIWAFCNNYLKNSFTVLILKGYYSVCIWLWSTLSFPDQKIPSEQKLRSFLQTPKAFGCVLHENKPLSILISYSGWWENCTDPKLHICVPCM